MMSKGGFGESRTWVASELNLRVEQEIPVNHSEFFAPVIEPTLSIGTQALLIAALTYLVKLGSRQWPL